MMRLDAAGASTRWFLRRGLASMAEGTTAYRSPSQRAAPALVLLFVVVMLTMVPGASANLPVSLGIASVAVLLTWVGGNLSAAPHHSPASTGSGGENEPCSCSSRC